MIAVIVRVDKKVVHVNDEPAFRDHVPERVGHESLKGGWGVGHAEEHDGWFIESSVGDEGGFPLVTFLYSDIVIPPSYVKLGEDLGVFKFVNEVRNQGEGVCISDSMAVEVSVILARSEASILFLNEEERGSLGGLGCVKDASLSWTHSFLPASWAGDTHEETVFLPIGYREVKERDNI